MNQIRRKLKNLNYWFWHDGQAWLIIILITVVLVVWIAFGVVKSGQ